MSDEIKDVQKKDNMIDSIIEETRYLSEKESMEEEASKLNKAKRHKGTVGKDEIYSTTSKEIRYTTQNPLDLADDEPEAEAEVEEKPEVEAKAEPEVNVTLTPEYEEGTKISNDIVEKVDNLEYSRVDIQDIDTIDIDIDEKTPEEEEKSQKNEKAETAEESEASADSAEKPEAEAAGVDGENCEPEKKQESEFEKLFGKAKPVSSAQTIVSRVPVYQHESKVEKVHVRAGKFSAVVENEYKKYIASPNPVISQMIKPEEEKHARLSVSHPPGDGRKACATRRHGRAGHVLRAIQARQVSRRNTAGRRTGHGGCADPRRADADAGCAGGIQHPARACCNRIARTV